MADKYNLPANMAKVNLLRKIDDAASQVGSKRNMTRDGRRDIGAKTTAMNVLSKKLNQSLEQSNHPFSKEGLD